MKKGIITVFGIIIVLILAGIVFNVVTDGSLLSSIVTGVAAPINSAWKSISGSDTDLIKTDEIESSFNDQEDKGMQDLFGTE